MISTSLTKTQKAELRRLAGVAHERELASAITDLEGEFARWRKGEINVFELKESIHKFHHGISRELYNHYEPRHADITVPAAIARGALREEEVDPSLLEHMAELIEFARKRQRET
jgi:hypothetical protein